MTNALMSATVFPCIRLTTAMMARTTAAKHANDATRAVT